MAIDISKYELTFNRKYLGHANSYQVFSVKVQWEGTSHDAKILVLLNKGIIDWLKLKC